ncbi:hypothetical protein QFC24_000952 [Naganishia onofrii]|uniref:Uncharacterized protein n=1 Tax=Naganishia onofrii TaxID=1851511 RepID=A0ACC2XUJ8_9TREE|nr:hypothetical protein QFC24_000952 [Naganishia onofrii]
MNPSDTSDLRNQNLRGWDVSSVLTEIASTKAFTVDTRPSYLAFAQSTAADPTAGGSKSLAGVGLGLKYPVLQLKYSMRAGQMLWNLERTIRFILMRYDVSCVLKNNKDLVVEFELGLSRQAWVRPQGGGSEAKGTYEWKPMELTQRHDPGKKEVFLSPRKWESLPDHCLFSLLPKMAVLPLRADCRVYTYSKLGELGNPDFQCAHVGIVNKPKGDKLRDRQRYELYFYNAAVEE